MRRYGEVTAVTVRDEDLRLSDLLPELEARLPQVVDELTELLAKDFPDYAAQLAVDAPESLAMAGFALRHLVGLADGAADDGGGATAAPGVFEEVGRSGWREGRELGLLLSAYRAGGRIAWRHIADAAVARGLPASAVATLAEAVFAFIEELSSASARGYVDEQRATVAERGRLRGQLAELLVTGRSDASVVRAVALRAGWTVPRAAAIVLVDPSDPAATAGLDRLDGSSLPLRTALHTGALVANPEAPGARARLERALAGSGAVVGSPVPLDELPSSLPIAEAALRLRAVGVIRDDPVWVPDHYDTVLVARDPWLLDRLRDQVLAPLDDLPPATRERLEETLAAFLAAAGDRRVAAGLLHVHPQTVRYRLRQLTDCFGATLTDPQSRLRLTLALCWPARPAQARSLGVEPIDSPAPPSLDPA